VGSTLSYGIENDSILIDLPLEIVAFDFELNYDLNQVSPSYEKVPEQLTLIHFDKTVGKMNVISEVKLDNHITIPFTLEEKESQIQLFLNGYDSQGNLVAQLMETITLNAVPEEYELSQNYPNPFNPVTRIEYGLPVTSHVHLAIYDLLGREVVTLVDGIQEAGYRSITWHGMNRSGNGVGAGMYFYVIQAGDFRQIKKMILLK
jgi:flagellar hook assembly protein FlgD